MIGYLFSYNYKLVIHILILSILGHFQVVIGQYLRAILIEKRLKICEEF